jgi:hypothetical protein
VQSLTAIDGDPIRDEIAGKVEKLVAKGGTCLGAGLKRGLDVSTIYMSSYDTSQKQLFLIIHSFHFLPFYQQVLKEKGDATGGVILFVTDGEQDCDGQDKTDLNDAALLQRVKDSKARIITVAFGYIVASRQAENTLSSARNQFYSHTSTNHLPIV